MSLFSSSKAISIEAIAFGILSRLPAKSVLRFKSVCKQWLALASDPFFLAAHTRCNPLTLSGFLIQEVTRGRLGRRASFSVDGGASPVLPDPSLSSLDHRFAESGGIYVSEHCNGLLLCETRLGRPPSSVFILNPTTMQYREIPDPPLGLYPIKHKWMLAFDPSTSFQYRIVCLRSNIKPNAIKDLKAFQLHVEIYSSDTGAWELSSATLPGERLINKSVYWNGALHYLLGDFFVSFDVEHQVVNTIPTPPCHRHPRILNYGESRGRLQVIEIMDILCISYELCFRIFEMEKDNPSWSLIYNVDLNGVMNVHPENGISSWPFCFARGGEGEDDKLYLTNFRRILCCTLAEMTCREIFPYNPFTSNVHIPSMGVQFFEVVHILFSP